jgi:hypothetical protein
VLTKLRLISTTSFFAALFVMLLVSRLAAGQWYPPQYPYPSNRGYPREADLKVNVTPKNAEVYVDGYYAGQVDDFDGPFQRLHVTPGEHEIVIYLRGHRSLTQHLYLSADSTRKITGQLEPLSPNERDPGPPTPIAPPRPPEAPPQAAAPPPGAMPRDPRHQSNGRTGMLAITVQPADAELQIDGSPWQAAHALQRGPIELPEGWHSIQVVKSGYRTFVTDVEIHFRQTTPLDVNLGRQ